MLLSYCTRSQIILSQMLSLLQVIYYFGIDSDCILFLSIENKLRTIISSVAKCINNILTPEISSNYKIIITNIWDIQKPANVSELEIKRHNIETARRICIKMRLKLCAKAPFSTPISAYLNEYFRWQIYYVIRGDLVRWT